MIKKSFLFVLAVFMLLTPLRAQNAMRVPYGSFEQWQNHPGYSISALFLTLSLYDAYTTPQGWSHLSYPINESFELLGSTININTNVPLMKVEKDSAGAPDSSYAVRLETFMLEDVLDPNTYNFFASSLDSMYTSTVFPTVLSTGEVNLDHFLPLMNSLLGNLDSAASMLSSFAGMDVNYLVTGGIPLGDFVPTRLTGSYKYQSATAGDNGAVLMLGTRYNILTHQREVVGGGANIEMTDRANYSPFTVAYEPFSITGASADELTPDSLIVLLVSSASLNRQQGSAFWVDDLMLWHDTVAAPDTCANIINLTATTDIHESTLDWSTTDVVDGFEMMYGAYNFDITTSGTDTLLSNNTITLNGLEANTDYTAYLRTVCHDTTYSDWQRIDFRTAPDTCTHLAELVLMTSDSISAGYSLHWSGYAEPEAWEMEYGLQDFELGTGTVQLLTNTMLDLATLDLLPGTCYDFYVRSVCSDSVYGDWDSVRFCTEPDTCARITSIGHTEYNYYDDDTRIEWQSSFDPVAWEVECCRVEFENEDGPDSTGCHFHSGQDVDLYEYYYHHQIVEEPSFVIPQTSGGYEFAVYVRSICDDNIYGEWRRYTFISVIIGIDDRSDITLQVSPNPAEGRCVVELAETGTARLNLYGMDGKLIQTIAYEGTPVEVVLPASGIYLLQAVTPQGTATRKIVSK